MKGWNGTNIQRTWLHKQGRGIGHGPTAHKWFCDVCQKEHGPKVDRIKVGEKTMCFRQFYKLDH